MGPFSAHLSSDKATASPGSLSLGPEAVARRPQLEVHWACVTLRHEASGWSGLSTDPTPSMKCTEDQGAWVGAAVRWRALACAAVQWRVLLCTGVCWRDTGGGACFVWDPHVTPQTLDSPAQTDAGPRSLQGPGQEYFRLVR